VFAAQKPDSLTWLPISDRHVEVSAEYEVGAIAQQGNTIENVVHRSDISALTDRPVYAEHH
jgi:hypothetical protein